MGEKHKFWSQQPVPQFDDTAEEKQGEGPIEAERSPSEVSEYPISLPNGFEWASVDVCDPVALRDVYTLLAEHYVEDEDHMFRLRYSEEFLLYALTPPGFHPDWHIGVRVAKSGRLVGLITAVPMRLVLRGQERDASVVNFLCVHKKIRGKRLAPVLIKEVTRRVNRQGVFQAAYATGEVLPRPVARCQYWHRSLNPLKLLDANFCGVPPAFEKFKRPRDATKRHFALPDSTSIPSLRPMTPSDVPPVTEFVNARLASYLLRPQFSEAETSHYLLPREGIVQSFVSERDGKITDFISFYINHVSVVGSTKQQSVKGAWNLYTFSVQSLKALIGDALILARNAGCDVYNVMDNMHNKVFVHHAQNSTELKFGIGDGMLQYYLFNWRMDGIKPSDVGLVTF